MSDKENKELKKLKEKNLPEKVKKELQKKIKGTQQPFNK